MKHAPALGPARHRLWHLRTGRNWLINTMRQLDRNTMQTKALDPRYRETPWGVSRNPARQPLIRKGRKP